MQQLGATPAAPVSSIVVINAEGQYSVWWEGRSLPAGWRATGTPGTRTDCLAQIAELWTDMRPRSLRERLAGR